MSACWHLAHLVGAPASFAFRGRVSSCAPLRCLARHSSRAARGERRPDLVDDATRLGSGYRPRVAQRQPPEKDQGVLPLSIAAELGPVAVIAKPVGFDEDAFRRPGEVEPNTATVEVQRELTRWWSQLSRPHGAHHDQLQPALNHAQVVVAEQHAPKRSGTPATGARVGLDVSHQLGQRCSAHDDRLADRALEGFLVDDPREIEQRAGGRCAGDAVDRGAVARGQMFRSVNCGVDAGRQSALEHHDVGPRRIVGNESRDRGSTAVRRPPASRDDRGMERPPWIAGRRSDVVDAWCSPTPPPGGAARRDLAASEAEVEELGTRGKPMLPGCEALELELSGHASSLLGPCDSAGGSGPDTRRARTQAPLRCTTRRSSPPRPVRGRGARTGQAVGARVPEGEHVLVEGTMQHTRHVDFPVFDSDMHYYEDEDAFIRFVPKNMQKRCMQWAHINGKKRLLVAGTVNRFIPNPTWDPIARPGSLDDYFRGKNTGGVDVKTMFGELDPLSEHPEYQDRDARLAVMDAQGVEAAFFFPTLAVGMQRSLAHDLDALTTAFAAFNRWMLEDWGFDYQNRIFAAPVLSLADVDKAVEQVEFAIDNGARMVCMVPGPVPTADGNLSPAWPTFDPVWARIAEAGLTVGIHGGDGGMQA
ncbi:MAG: amidohydrolase family protein, partial [Actinobacteria bacterium]|nr:amidohydrolase family protein [Actinomycetota bacterium]